MGLILSRKRGQRIRVGKEVVITIISEGRAVLKIDAPKEVKVLRDELEQHNKDKAA